MQGAQNWGVWALGLLFSSCVGVIANPTCESHQDCRDDELCLPAGQCAKPCQATPECAEDYKCSKAGGCVPYGSCGADSDCGGGFMCSLLTRTCQHECDVRSCRVNADGGVWRPSPDEREPDAGFDAGPSHSGTDAGCGGSLFAASSTPANVYIVLDRSGSMNFKLATGEMRWTVATAAVRKVTATYEGQVRFGLMVFPQIGTQCGGSTPLVSLGLNQAQLLSMAIPALPGPINRTSTPIAGALNHVSTLPELQDAQYSNYIMLVTDGKEECGGDPLPAAQKLFSQNIRTFVVGFSNGVSADALTALATAGGTARQTAPVYYQADDASSLELAMKQIIQGAAGCDFLLKSTPPDLNKLFLYVNGVLVPRDSTRQNGWDYSNNNTRIGLFGPACDALTAQPNGKVTLVYGCPDPTIVDSNPDGGGGSGSGGSNGIDGGITIN